MIPRSPETSNNVAEYRALMEALAWLVVKGLDGEEVLVRGDSKLVIEQMFGTWKIRAGYYAPLARQCKTIVKRFRRISGRWIPREQNTLADELSKRELQRQGVKFKIQPVEEEAPRPAAARHSWEKSDVEVLWSALPGHLYTCRRCGMTRQSIPSGHYYVSEFTTADGKVSRGKTPPCPGLPGDLGPLGVELPDAARLAAVDDVEESHSPR